MSAFTNALSVSTSGLKAQSQRLRIVAENVANTDTPGYHRKTVQFGTTPGISGVAEVEIDRVSLDRREGERIYDPGHPMSDATGHFTGSNVELVIEIADAREAQRSYEANLKMFDQVRQMSTGLMDLLRK
ncbi:flagellar basal body rod protein FlgC [Marivita hallyeonensis]|uniref:Flagellar basal-body rod protein FlgC n=1 Tax=Marivita hallyeonensis TaxID=996342 RepID=A0A1M5UM81_9RHOB|nr:flagellar basal body rod protein FlgC [Marivita hallyeonensis]SHH64027.1 flagellar basal-body rod protein FlgC [Marivita hallyeonensis]